MGADIAASWPDRLAMLASVPTLSRGAMREGTVHATDPAEGGEGAVAVSGAKNRETERCADDQNGLAHTIRIPAPLDESIDQPPTDDNIRERSKQPRCAGVKRRVQQVHVVGNGKIAGEPVEKQEEAVVVCAPAERETVDLPLRQ